MHTYTLQITPEIAKQWLDGNTRNRPIKKAHVQRLAREMTEGRWKENGETIKRNGTALLDGQHRLLACIATGKPFTTLVVEGLSEDIFDTIDANVPRSSSDMLALLGEKHTKRLAASLILVDRYMTGRMDLKSARRYTNIDIEQLLEKYPTIRSSVGRSDFNQRLVPPSIVSALHFLFSQKDSGLADLFIEQVLRGTGMAEGDPVYILRERLVRNSLEKSKLESDYITALMVKAWNATRLGVKIKQLRFRERGENPETFPLIA